MNATIKDNTLIIAIPLSEPRASSTGKNLVVASTGGGVRTTAQVNGKPLTVNVTAYFKP